jgi:hypothetical protein
MTRELEVVTLQIANGGWNNFIIYLSRGHVARCCLFYPFVDCSFELCNN